MTRVGNLATLREIRNRWIYIYIYELRIYLSTIVFAIVEASLIHGWKRDANLEWTVSLTFTFIENPATRASSSRMDNSVGEISSATVKEPVDRVIFDRVPPRIHVDSIMQKYDNLPTRSGPGQINALSGPDPNAGSPLQLEDHNIFLRGIGVSTSLSPVLNLLCNCPSYRAIPLVSSVKAIVPNLSREKWFSVIHGIIV